MLTLAHKRILDHHHDVDPDAVEGAASRSLEHLPDKRHRIRQAKGAGVQLSSRDLSESARASSLPSPLSAHGDISTRPKFSLRWAHIFPEKTEEFCCAVHSLFWTTRLRPATTMGRCRQPPLDVPAVLMSSTLRQGRRTPAEHEILKNSSCRALRERLMLEDESFGIRFPLLVISHQRSCCAFALLISVATGIVVERPSYFPKSPFPSKLLASTTSFPEKHRLG